MKGEKGKEGELFVIINRGRRIEMRVNCGSGEGGGGVEEQDEDKNKVGGRG